MPRYFFHHMDGSVDHDDEGVELPDLNAARTEAVVFAGASLRDDPDQLWQGENFRVEITDVSGALLFTVVMMAIDGQPSGTSKIKDRG